MFKRHRTTSAKAAGLVLAALSLVVSLLPALPAQAATTFAKISFGVADITPPTGYTVDSGQSYTDARGYGWVDFTDSNPIDLTGNTRYSWTKAQGFITVLQMQQKATTGVITGGRWQYAIANGTYDVTVTAGDARSNDGINLCCNDATNRLTVEGVLAVNDFHGTAAQPLTTQTVTVAVTDGKITVDPVGGINTKIDRVVIASASGPAQPVTPVVTSVLPAASATQVALNGAVSLGLSQSVDLSTVNASNFTLTGPSGVVAGNYNADAAGGTASFTPSANLAVNTVYTVATNSGLKSAGGLPFAPFTSTFTTGTAPPPLASTAFTKLASVPVPKPNVLTIGPDNDLYVGTASGKLFRYTRAADGTLSNGESITPFGNRVITGLAFDPTNPTTLWVTNNYAGYDNAPRMSGHISTITIQSGQPLSADVASAADVIVGLPRSMHDHMTNGIAFGPDGKLYIAQGANTAYGAPDSYWGPRGEAPLTASILVADVDNATTFPPGTTLDVNTDTVGTTEDTGSDAPVGYDPTAANAPLTVYAYGTRNPFTLLWDSNGSLYAPVNESASGGNTPSPASNNPPPALNVQAYTDYFTRIVAGKYYGHPNPAQGYYTLNGGNPTAQGDPYEVTEYPVGVQPDPNWQAPDFAMGVHRSPDGAAEYTNSSAFSGALKGKILVSEYSDGDDLVAVNLNGSGKPVSEAVLPDATTPGQALIFNNPLGVATDSATGVVYVAEAQSESDPTAGVVTLLTPGTVATVNNGVHVNFQPSSVTAPTGYAADTGAPFNGSTGWQDFTGAPLDLTANTRVRHNASSPDVRYDTQILMQAGTGSGNTTPGQWATTLPNGQYDVTVAVGDPTAINSVDEIVAQPGTANAATIIDHYVPTNAAPWSTQTKRITVSNGTLVLSPAGGSNTKLDFVDAVPAGADTIAPSVSLALAGPQSGDSNSPYVGPVTITATATDNVGVTSTSYVLDSGASTPYTAPVVVSSVGSHTITVTAQDAAGNPGTATSTFSISSTAPTSLHVNFAAQTSAAVAGYVNDYGQAFTAASGSGWENAADGTPASLVGNGRERNSSLSPDKRYDTLVQMQQTAQSSGGTLTPGQWEHALANGSYDVTVAVGDATATNSVDRITAEPGTANAVTIINNFQAVPGTLFQTVTKRVTISDGFLTLNATGGTNTKIDFVDAVPAAVDTIAPTVSVALAGALASGTTYNGPVKATVTASDNVAVTTLTYTLDGGPTVAYTAPVVVTTTGSHTFVVTASDAVGNTTIQQSLFTISSTAPTSAHVDFGTQTSVPVSGYTLDYGLAFDPIVGSGWENAADGTPASLVGNGRERNSSLSPDKRYDTLVQMQQTAQSSGGTLTPGQWEFALANGDYNVTVAVGDATATNSVDRITAEPGTANAVTIINNFQAVTGTLFQTVTKRVTVSDGRLTLNATGGSNTKIDFVDVVPAAPLVDTTPPTASIALAGTGTGVSGHYQGNVTATVTAADEALGSGLKSVTYSLDGGADTPYTTPVVVTSVSSHTLSVTATDNSNNVFTTSSTWTIDAPPPPDTTPPTASIALAGSTNGTIYTGDVTATVTAADEAGGSGLKTVTYSLDGGAATAYTVPVVVHAAGNHSLTVTASDIAGNTFTTPATTWTSQIAETMPPTVSVALAGTLYSPGVYTGNVTATVTAADGNGGSGLASVTYSLDGGAVTAYTVPVVVSTLGAHTLAVTVADNEGNQNTASKSWTQQAPDTTAPTDSIALAGSNDGAGNYTGDVTVTVTAADEVGGSGLKTVTYSLDGAAAKAYTAPVIVTATGGHTVTVTATDNAGNINSSTSASWNQLAAGIPHLTVTSPDDAVLGTNNTRLVFSAVRGFDPPAPRAYTFTNDGTSALTVSNLAVGGTNAGDWTLAAGQAASVVIPAGTSVQVNLQFKPADPTGCPDSTNTVAISPTVDRTATLTYASNAPGQATGSALLSGAVSCYVGGNNEPVLDQLLPALGYTDVVDTQYIDRRYIGPARWLQNTDEIQSPYFNVADSTKPVSLVPIAHYGSGNASSAYQSTGWYAKGAAIAEPSSTCNSACKLLWKFPADTMVGGTLVYNQNQKLLPTPTGTTTFSPTGTFGLYSSDFSEVNFSDDSLNLANTTANVPMPVPHYLHQMRIFPAYGPGHVLIPNTYIVADDLSRVPPYKNNDYQDVILLLRNVTPAVAQGPVIGAATSTDLTTGGTVSPTCSVSGFDGVLANTGGTQCNAPNISFGANGLSLTSTAGQLANSNQQNALYKNFDATRNGWTVTARVLGPVNQLTSDYQQIGAWFGPDQANFVKVEAEHNGTGDPHLTMFYSEKGVSGTVASVTLPAMTTATTLDLVIKGNGNVPDPLPYGDTYGVHSFPLDELTVYYSLNGGALVQVGTTKFPADVTGWFNRMSKAGILVSNSGATTPITATFTKFTITAP
jgi:Bacterial Ig-like domain/Glucose / Sorbosone dehydrogenase